MTGEAGSKRLEMKRLADLLAQEQSTDGAIVEELLWAPDRGQMFDVEQYLEASSASFAVLCSRSHLCNQL